MLLGDTHVDDAELETLGVQTYERVSEICDALDESLRGIVTAGVTARWCFQRLKFLYDGLLAQGLGAARIAESRAPRRALLLIRADSLAASILPTVLGELGVEITLSLARGGGPVAAPRSGARDRLAGQRIRLRRAVRRGRPRVLCLDEGYSMPAIVAELRRRGAEPLLWLPLPRRSRPLRALDFERLAPLFRIAGLDLWPAAEHRLRYVVEYELAYADAALRSAVATVRRDRPDVLLGSTYASISAKAAAVAARAAGVPSVVARHGELGSQQLPVMRFNDLDVVDWELCWGEWEARFVDAYAARDVQKEVVGAPMIEAAAASAPGRSESRRRHGFRDDELVVLLAPNALEGDAWFAGGRAPPDLSHVRHQVALVEQLLKLEGVRIAIKEHPQWPNGGPLAAWSEATGASVTFIREPQLADIAHLADASVLDYPATTLVQALSGSARLYVIRRPSVVWEPGVTEHLERHHVRFVDAQDLAATLRADLAAGSLGAPVVYSQTALEPLVASGSGTAAERAADAVMRIASG